jgi:succinoglycan biosynthesis protein ExoA
MPVLNEEAHLAQAAGRVLSQDYPAGLELILALGPSRDGSTRIARRLAAADPRVILVDNPSGRIPAAINAAIKAARHPVIARVDGHALVPPGYLLLAARTLAATGAVNVGGVMAAEGETPFQQAVAWAMTSSFGVGSARNHCGGGAGPADTVYLGVFRRSAIEQAGGYDEEYLRAEDWELNYRIRQAGGLIWFDPRIRVTYLPRSCPADLSRQYFHYGRWRRVVSRQHPGTINGRYLAPPAATAAIAGGTLAGLAGLAGLAAGVPGRWPGLALTGLAAPAAYTAGVLTVTSRAARELRPSAAARLPLAMAIMHLSWGAGFLTSPRGLVPRGQVPPARRARGPARPAARPGWSPVRLLRRPVARRGL